MYLSPGVEERECKTYIVLMNDNLGELNDVERVEGDDSFLSELVELGRAARKFVGNRKLMDVIVSVDVQVSKLVNILG